MVILPKSGPACQSLDFHLHLRGPSLAARRPDHDLPRSPETRNGAWPGPLPRRWERPCVAWGRSCSLSRASGAAPARPEGKRSGCPRRYGWWMPCAAEWS